jgi:hypothetical protein
LHDQLIARLLERDQGIVDFLESHPDRLLIPEQRLLLLCFRLAHLATDAARGEDRHGQRAGVRPDPRRPGEQFRELAARRAEQARQGNRRKGGRPLRASLTRAASRRADDRTNRRALPRITCNRPTRST